MTRIYFLSIAVLSLFFGACANLKPLTKDIVEDYAWSKDELLQIQFYPSRDIVLERAFSGGMTEIENGKVKVVDGAKIEQVVIPEHTPGLAVFIPEEDKIAISFEESDDSYLMFGANPNYGNRFQLLASEWKKHKGVVTYNGNKYTVTSDAAFASILIDMQEIKKYEKKSRTVSGRTIHP